MERLSRGMGLMANSAMSLFYPAQRGHSHEQPLPRSGRLVLCPLPFSALLARVAAQQIPIPPIPLWRSRPKKTGVRRIIRTLERVKPSCEMSCFQIFCLYCIWRSDLESASNSSFLAGELFAPHQSYLTIHLLTWNRFYHRIEWSFLFLALRVSSRILFLLPVA